jgi:hypothetical protein
VAYGPFALGALAPGDAEEIPRLMLKDALGA